MGRRFINWGCVGPALIYLAVAIGIAAGAITLLRREHHTAPVLNVIPLQDDALTRQLALCQSLGRKAENDESCTAAWAENRRRFFGDPFDKAFHP
jgi:conjugative transfer region protein TrbK